MCGPEHEHLTQPRGQCQGQANVDPDKAARAARDAANGLARLIESQLGYEIGHIDPIALRLFIRAYWARVAAYAHTIHDEK
jgi:hypothetical protein